MLHISSGHAKVYGKALSQIISDFNTYCYKKRDFEDQIYIEDLISFETGPTEYFNL